MLNSPFQKPNDNPSSSSQNATRNGARSLRVNTLVVLLVLLLAISLCACNSDVNDESTTYGYTVSGRVTLDDAALQNVAVSSGEISDVTNEYGIFLLRGLKSGDVVAFSLDGYTFSPDSVTVSETCYDLRISASQITTPQEGGSNPDDNESGNQNDNPSGNPSDTEDDPSGDNPETPSPTVYNCKNGSLLFINSSIKLVFCVNNGFSTLSVTATSNGVSTSVIVSETDVDDDTEIDGTTYATYVVDVTDLCSGAVVFNVKAANGNGIFGDSISVNYTPANVLQSPVVSADGLALSWSSVGDGVSYVIFADGVKIASTDGLSFDISALSLSGSRNVCVYAVKTNYYSARSNVVAVDFGD